MIGRKSVKEIVMTILDNVEAEPITTAGQERFYLSNNLFLHNIKVAIDLSIPMDYLVHWDINDNIYKFTILDNDNDLVISREVIMLKDEEIARIREMALAGA